uniref:Uncharacterized protein n=1 Tax=Rousettus aegyptiacus TaxID=9407 RepID=A0A7J8CIN4_ROUAE|nr:hypothetical protein HJG63_009106 [Rousettus aegyptiacus]
MTHHRPRFMCCSNKLPVPPQGPSKFRGPRFLQPLSLPPPGRAPVPGMELISFRLRGVERICRQMWTPWTRQGPHFHPPPARASPCCDASSWPLGFAENPVPQASNARPSCFPSKFFFSRAVAGDSVLSSTL